MPYFPFFVNIENMNCLIVGGGHIALRKIRKLLPFNPKINIVSEKVLSDIREIPKLTILQKSFCDEDLRDAEFVIAATEDNNLNKHISELCKEKRILCNVVDDPENCTFFFPALVQHGDITVGISTSGKSPIIAARLREEIDESIDDKVAEICGLMGKIRPYVKNEFSDEDTRRTVMKAALDFCFDCEKIPEIEELLLFLKGLKEQ